MADISMDNVNIEIQSSSEKASQGVEQLIDTLSKLNEKLEQTQINANQYGENLGKNIKNIFKNFKMPKIPKMPSLKENTNIFEQYKTPKIKDPNENINNNSNKAKENISEINKKMAELGSITSATGKRIKQMLSFLEKVVVMRAGLKAFNFIFGDIGSKAMSIGNGFKILAKNLSKYSLALFGIRSAFYAVRNVSNEFLSSQDATAKQLSTNISYLKYALGSMLAPIITYITNLIYKLLQAIQYVVYYFTKINIFAGKTAKSYANMGASAGKATKELQKQLQAFDELNNINLEKNNGAGGGSGGGIAPSLDLSTINDGLKPLFDDIDNLGKNLADKINKALASIDWNTIIEKTTSMTKKVTEILNDFTKELNFELIGYTIAQGFNTVFANLNTFFGTYNWNILGEQLAKGLNSIIHSLNWGELGKTLTNNFRALIETLYPIVTNLDWIGLGKGIGDAIAAGFSNIDWVKVGKTINNGIIGILDAILAAIDAMNVDQIAKDIADMLSQINFKEIFTKVLLVAAEVIKGLGKILWEAIFSGDGDLAKVLFLIIDAVAVVKIFKTLFKQLAIQSFAKILASSLNETSGATKGLTTNLKGAETATVSLKTGFNNLLTSLGKATQTIAVLGGLKLVIDSLSGLLKTFAESGLSVGDTLLFLGGTIATITIAFSAMMLVMKNLEPSWQSIAGAAVILGGLALVLNQVTNLLNVFTQSGMSLNEVIGLMLAIFIPIVALMGAIALIGPAMTAGLLPFLVVVAGISALLLVMSATLPPILDACKNFIQGVAPSIVKVLNSIFNGIDKIVNTLGNVLPPIIDAIGNLFQTIFNGIANVVTTVGNVIISIFKEVNTTLTTIFNGIGNVFSTVFNGMANVAYAIGNVITSIFNGIGNVATSIGKAIEGVLNSISRLINSTLQGLLNFAWQIGPAVENSVNHIISAVRNLINFVVSAIEYLVNNVVVPGMNAMINSLNKLPAVNISRASTIKLPRFSGYEEGGFPKEGDLFFANEAGPEMIGSIGNKTAVANNDQITKAIAEATYQAVSQALGENSNNGQPIIVNVGNETLYKGMQKSRSQASNQYGITV